MPEHSVGDAAQTRIIVEQVVDAAIIRFKDTQPIKAEMPGVLKWVAGIAASVFAALVTSGCIWMVVTLSDMKNDVTQLTTQLGAGGAIEARFNELNRRMDRIERQQGSERGHDK